MAAGMGSRFGGNKQVAKIGPSGEMLMEYSVYDAIKCGFNRIVFVIRPEMREEISELISSMKNSHPTIQFHFSEQCLPVEYEGIAVSPLRTKPLGTVHALLSAAEFIDAPFAIINADDYYGRHAFASISSALSKLEYPEDAAIITYALKNTLSRHGAVTRGICSVEKGFLKSIRESYKVTACEDGLIYEKTQQGLAPISECSMVSMNMWAFHHGIIGEIKSYFLSFLSGLEPTNNKSECLLPVMAESLIEAGKIRISAYPTESRWFGLTYKEDSEDAAWELDKRHQDGTYPQKLFP